VNDRQTHRALKLLIFVGTHPTGPDLNELRTNVTHRGNIQSVIRDARTILGEHATLNLICSREKGHPDGRRRIYRLVKADDPSLTQYTKHRLGDVLTRAESMMAIGEIAVRACSPGTSDYQEWYTFLHHQRRLVEDIKLQRSGTLLVTA
jgi:hypothetical protein